MENAESDKISVDEEINLEDIKLFPAAEDYELWVRESEIEDAINEKQNELILVTASLDIKERRNKELEMELEKAKVLWRESQLSDRRLKFHGANELLLKENEELRRKIAAQEAKSNAEWDEIVSLRIEALWLRAKLKKQAGATEDAVFEEIKSKIHQLENSSEEKRAVLKDKEWNILQLEDLLKSSEGKVSELKEEIERLKLETEEIRKLKKEKESLLEEKQRLEDEVQMISQAMETLKAKQTERLKKWADASSLIFDLLNEELGLDYKAEETEMKKEGPTLRKRVKKTETVTSDDQDGDDNMNNPGTSSAAAGYSSGEEFSFQAKVSRGTGRKSRRGRPYKRSRV